jgi:AcrR family transcriptional regulator
MRVPLAPAPADEVRARVLAGMAAAVAEKGYAAATIGDVARLARISKRTFYDHFADKEACYLAAYEAAAERLLGVVAAAARSRGPASERVEGVARAYLTALAADPATTRTFLVEILGAGPRAVQLRQAVHRRFAELLRRLVEDDPDARGVVALSGPMATAVVGGINELVITAVADGGVEDLPALSPDVARLVHGALVASSG